jgi:hypothetical protein
MTLTVRTKEWFAGGAVVPAFNGRAEKFIVRAFRLFRRRLLHVNGDAGKVLTKHLRAHVPADAVNCTLAHLTTLYLEIHVLDRTQDFTRTSAKWSSKHEFFLIALIEANQRHDKVRASESAIALLDTFEVANVLEAARTFAQRLEEFELRLMPIGDAAFSYFADYKPIDEALVRPNIRGALVDATALRIVG